MVDNGSVWLQGCQQFRITTVKKTRPYKSQTNGEIERFHRMQPAATSHPSHD